MQIQRWFQALWRRSLAACRVRMLFLLLCAPCAHALEFSYGNPFPDGPLAGVARTLTISGHVVSGDTGRLIALMQRKPADAWHALGRVELAITGGDSTEALLLADTLAVLYPHTVATADCAGACATVWLSGAWRLLPKGRIGLQTPSPTPAVNTSPKDAPPPFDMHSEQLRHYLLKQGLPPAVYQRWMAEDGNRVYWLSGPEINVTGIWPPYYYQRLSARCPPLDASDESYHALRRCAARLVISHKAFAFDKLMAGVDDPWWNSNRDVLRNAPR